MIRLGASTGLALVIKFCVALSLLFSVSSFVNAREQMVSTEIVAAHQKVKPKTLDELLNVVRQSQLQDIKKNTKREFRFIEKTRERKKLLSAAQREFDSIQRRNNPLKQKLEKNKDKIKQLKKNLQTSSVDVGDMYSIARQVTGDFHATVSESLVSAQYPERLNTLLNISTSKALPTTKDLEALWFLMQQEMTESGKVVTYPAKVLSADGTEKKTLVTRVGLFSVMADGEYLRYLPSSGELLALSKQPPYPYGGLATTFPASDAKVSEVMIDPTRGSILKVLVQRPSIAERISQGGTVGLIIIGLGAIGLLLTVARMIYHFIIGTKVSWQLNNIATPKDNNPLGRILAASQQAGKLDQESMELRLDEAIIREMPKLETGQSLIKLLAAVAPLLGLLGTVTGMISTFQAITLYGTGDPKLMAGGISQALVTTVLGLVVAIPLLFGHNLVASRTRSMVQLLDEQSAGLIAKNSERQSR